MEKSKVISKYEKFTMEEVNRSKIKNAEYNPRKLSDKAKKKLKDNLEKVGLIQPITWNRITGNIVSGHQRVALLDSLHKSKKYSLSVAVVEMDEKTEKEQNIFMNNTGAQGQFDDGLLESLLKEIDIGNTGFDSFDSIIKTMEIEESIENIIKINDEIKESKNQKKREKDKAYNKKLENEVQHDYYFVVYFKNDNENNNVCDIYELDKGYVLGNDLIKIIKEV